MRRDFYSAIEDLCTASRCCQCNKETHRNRCDVVGKMQRLVQLDTKCINYDALNNEVAYAHIGQRTSTSSIRVGRRREEEGLVGLDERKRAY